MHSVFVFGILPESSGKTVVSAALARGIVNRGLRACVFKPRSGHNLWYQYDLHIRCKKEGKLFCEDILKLRAASKCSLPVEVLNPVDALMSPLNIRGFIEKGALSRFYFLEPDVFSHLVAERYTLCRDGIERILCVNALTLRSRSVMSDLELIEELERSADDVLYLKSLDDWARAFKTYGSEAIRSCYRRLSGEADHVIVEGFNDAVCPEKTLRYDVLIGVAPGVAVFYDAGEFHALLETFEGLGKDPESLRAEDILKYLKKIKIQPIPALPSTCLRDYDALSRKLEGLVETALRLTEL